MYTGVSKCNNIFDKWCLCRGVCFSRCVDMMTKITPTSFLFLSVIAYVKVLFITYFYIPLRYDLFGAHTGVKPGNFPISPKYKGHSDFCLGGWLLNSLLLCYHVPISIHWTKIYSNQSAICHWIHPLWNIRDEPCTWPFFENI